jgi:hypothetical protein
MESATAIQEREKSLALTVRERYALLALRNETIEELARSIDEHQKRVSDTMNDTRKNFRIRRKIAKHFNLTYERCWGEVDPGRARRQAKRKLRLASVKPD